MLDSIDVDIEPTEFKLEEQVLGITNMLAEEFEEQLEDDEFFPFFTFLSVIIGTVWLCLIAFSSRD